MSEISTIALHVGGTDEDGTFLGPDPHGLLEPGSLVIDICPGSANHLARGVVVWHGSVCWDYSDRLEGDRPKMTTSMTGGTSLLLLVDGKLVQSSIDRLDRAMGIQTAPRARLGGEDAAAYARGAAERGAHWFNGTSHILDADGIPVG